MTGCGSNWGGRESAKAQNALKSWLSIDRVFRSPRNSQVDSLRRILDKKVGEVLVADMTDPDAVGARLEALQALERRRRLKACELVELGKLFEFVGQYSLVA